MPEDLKVPFDPREVIARIVDGSDFDEFKPLYGTSLVTGWATLHGYPIGILANARGVLFSAESQKAAQFIQLANQIEMPLLFLQNTTGYMVGASYEQAGIIKHGAMMINAVANSRVPHLTIVLGASYGAGNYGMCGRAYDPRFLFAWPSAKSAVMGPAQLAGVLSIVGRQSAAARGESYDEDADAAMRAAVKEQIEAESQPFVLSGRLYDDGVIDPRDTRTVLGMCLAAIFGRQRRRCRCWAARCPECGTARRGPTAYSGCDHRADQQPAGRQPRRDRPPGVAHLPPAGHRDRRGVLRPGRGLAARREADLAVRLPGATPAQTYLNAGALIVAAVAAGADAVHPGYGFLAEDPEFARAVLAAGLIWVGPPPEAMAAIALKIEARKRASSAGLPVLAELDPQALPPFPVLVKASAVVAAAACGWCSPRPTSVRRSNRPSGRRCRRSATARCSASRC